MIWLTWRQHRLAIIATTVGVAALVLVLLVSSGRIDEVTAACSQHDCWMGTALALGHLLELVNTALNMGLPALGAIVAVFWGAPLLSREYESRTQVFSWSQDYTPVRWLVTKVALLAAVVVVLAALSGFAAQQVFGALQRSTGDPVEAYQGIDLQPGIQVAYALFGLALGVAVGAVVRRLVPAMAITLVLFGLVRFTTFLSYAHWLPSLRALGPATVGDGNAMSVYGEGSAVLTKGYLDAAGNQVEFPMDCYRGQIDDTCPLRHGVAHVFYDYQPFDRLPIFQLLLLGVYLVLTVGLFALAWYRLRRSVQVG